MKHAEKIERGDRWQLAFRCMFRREAGSVHPSIIIGVTTVELASPIPDTTTSKLKKAESFLF